MTKNSFTDDELWKSVVMDSSQAFATLYNRYWKKLYQTTLYYLKDTDTAEQVLQDVFVVLWKKRAQLKIDNFKAYIYITARYHVFTHLRAAKLDPVEYIEHYTENLEQADYNIAEEKLNYNDLMVQLEQNLKKLPKRCREIFWMSRIENLSNEEIALKLGISKRTVENQITQALSHLRSVYKNLSAIGLAVLFVALFK
jgi:RNA polymerase sigma-70 factor (family 1)